MSRHQNLADALGDEAARALHDWSAQHQVDLDLLRRLDGQSAARIALVLEQAQLAYPRKIVVKRCPPDGDDGLHEPRRHMDAWHRTRYEFAIEHLVKYVHEPLPAGNGDWIVFQEYRGGNCETLARLLDSVTEVSEPRLPRCNAKDLAATCRTIVRSVLDEWLPPTGPRFRCEPVNAGTFLGRFLDHRLVPGGSLHRWVTAHAPELLNPSTHRTTLAGTTTLNPLALATDPSLSNGHMMYALCGLVHGDLHPGNILVPMKYMYGLPWRRPVASGYRLIDLARFYRSAPIAFDPAHLIVSIVARHLGRMTEDQRTAAINVLVEPTDYHSGDLLPTWLRRVIRAVHGAVPPWATKSFPTEWREQTLLALVACGLVFTGRSTTADEHRLWFFRLAARAGEVYLGLVDGSPPLPHGPDRPRPLPSIKPSGAPKAPADIDDATDPEQATDRGDEMEMLPVEPTGLAECQPHGREDTQADEDDMDSACDALATTVLAQWSDAADGRRLVSPEPIRVRWEKTRLPVVGPLPDADHPRIADRGDLSTLFDVYCDLSSSRLVILGPEGSGKTAAAIRLAREVLQYRSNQGRTRRAEVAVPVILTPHDWDPLNQTVTEWLAQRLAADYPELRRGRYRSDVLMRALREGRVALVLDGLDDMPAPARALALEQIDTTPGMRIVVISRSAEMVAASAERHLTSAAAVELKPVEPEEAAAYVVRCQVDPLPDGWAAVVETVRTQPQSAIAQALDSPLMLGLLRDTYTSADRVEELIETGRFPTRQAIEDRLLGRLLPVAYRSRPDKRARYTLHQAQHWLGHFAGRMHQANTRDLAWWELPRWVPRWRSCLLLSVVAGLLPSVVFAWLAAPSGRALHGVAAGYLFGLAATLFDAFVVNITHPDRRRPAFRIKVGYVIGNVLAGASSGALLAGASDAPLRLLAGLGVGLGVGLVLGVPIVARAVRVLGVNSRPAGEPDSPLSPAACWRQDLRAAASFGIRLALTIGVTIALVCLLVGEPLLRVVVAVGLEVVVMPCVAVALSISAKTWQATLQLFFARQGPPRLIHFLEDARDRNVLRTAGSVYQFRHARLQDLLARSYLDANPDADESRPPRRRLSA